MKQLTDAEMNNMRHAGKVLAGALKTVETNLRAGMTTLDLDKMAEEYILSNGCVPCFKGLYGYKFTINASVNDEIIHGLPSNDKVLNEGDIVKIDCGTSFNGICTDAARTFGVGKISNEAKEIIQVTKTCFDLAVQKISTANEVSIIGKTIENYIKGLENYSILENYFGHGIGRKVHEDPLIPNYVIKNDTKLSKFLRTKFQTNTAVCIEPMILASKNNNVKVKKDGWTVVSSNGALTGHYENTVLITNKGIEILTKY